MLEESSDDVLTHDQIFKASDMLDDSVSNLKVKCAEFNYAEFITGMPNPVKEQFEECKSLQFNVQYQKHVRQSCNMTRNVTDKGDLMENKASKGKVEVKGQDAESTSREEQRQRYREMVLCQCQLHRIPGTCQLKKEGQHLHVAKKVQRHATGSACSIKELPSN